MSKIFDILKKLLPLIPGLFSAVQSIIGLFKKKHDPEKISSVAADEVKSLLEHKKSASEADWDIVKSGQKDE